MENCCSQSTNLCLEFIMLFLGAIIGAIIAVFVDKFVKYIKDRNFKRSILKPREGTYKITLKNGEPVNNKIETARISNAKKRQFEISVEINDQKEGNASGIIDFVKDYYGIGIYKHINSNSYGLYEFFLLPDKNKIAVLRKYTTDKASQDRKPSESIETSMIWERIEEDNT